MDVVEREAHISGDEKQEMYEKTSRITSSGSTCTGSDEDVKKDEDVKEEPIFIQPFHLELDKGNERLRYRQSWWKIWLPKDPPPPPRTSLADAPIIPIASASILSMLTYTWISPMMVLGYQRTLQAPDLWKMDPTREAAYLSSKLDDAWKRRVEDAKSWNARLESGEVKPGFFRQIKWSVEAIASGRRYGDRLADLEEEWRSVSGRRSPSLAWALNDTLGRVFWLGGIFKVIGDTSQLMGPVIVREIIRFSQDRVAAKEQGRPVPNIGRGIGMAFGAFIVTVLASVCQHQFFWRSMTTGVLARAALIGSIYKRGINLTGKARTGLTNAALVNHISTDVSRVDACAQWFHAIWTAPIQTTVCLIILLSQLGPSALAGFSLFLLIIPFQERVMAYQFRVGEKFMAWTDKRAQLLLEVLGAMRVVKYFTYEIPFLDRIFHIRDIELKGIRKIQFTRSANIAFAFSVPALAATLAFLTYTLTAHSFNVAVIFSSLSLFQLLRQPLMFLPRALSAASDASNALARLTHVYEAEMLSGETFHVDPEQELALNATDANFEWEQLLEGKENLGNIDAKTSDAVQILSSPFQVRNVNMAVKRGTLVSIVGPVGCGKSSLLQGLIGEMRRVSGQVSFGGRVAYCSQMAWIQNATLRDNILFGRPFDEHRYWQIVEKASLVPDLQVLPDGDLTEIGEKGINLSGGQRQRVNIARALYADPDIIILDDPLSAVDAHVGKALFQDAILKSVRDSGKTVILVTHALHFLSQCDYIYILSNGAIIEHGTYEDLMAKDGNFARLDKEFGGITPKKSDNDDIEGEIELEHPQHQGDLDQARQKSETLERLGAGTGKLEGRLIVKEKRTTGSLSGSVYAAYSQAGHGWITVPLIVTLMVLMQCSQVFNSYTLVWWEANTWHRPNSFYQILYACLGVSQAIFTLLLGIAMDYMSFFVSQNLHHTALTNIFYACMSFFDTTPQGRILSIFGKDIDTIDNQLPISMRMLVLTVANVIGAVLIVTILEHYFIIAAVGVFFGYNYFAAFYRASAREMKRLDSMLRSILYAHFSESLTGLATIRSYGEVQRFIRDDLFYIDLEDRALFLTVTNQRWLAIRLDFLGGIMVFVIAIFAVIDVSGIAPAQIGLVLTYTTSLTQLCGMLTRQTAEVENYMNSVERVVHYSRGDSITQEPPHEINDRKPSPEWPTEGAVEFRDVSMSYRPGLPKVLKGISLTVEGGEKIGVVGRTGAGKSSLMLCLFRIVELSGGSINIDGIDISTIGLRDLRSRISIIPQEPLLFSGTIRSNLDPFGLYDDARLWDALRRSYLVDSVADAEHEKPKSEKDEVIKQNRLSLDTQVESEGANLSVGERSLLSLARALVKNSRIVIMDEATASVDLETDSKIQRTIQTEFRDRTLLCIAHRLRTIISYDRILVLDSGAVAEFDTPLNLFLRENSIFRSLCERSNITVNDIEKSRILL